MPQTVTVDPGPYGDEDMTVDELPAGEFGVVVQLSDDVSRSATDIRAGDPVVRLGNWVGFPRSGHITVCMESRVRRLRPGERVVIEPQAET